MGLSIDKVHKEQVLYKDFEDTEYTVIFYFF